VQVTIGPTEIDGPERPQCNRLIQRAATRRFNDGADDNVRRIAVKKPPFYDGAI